jgi:hypothetical protein
VVVVEDYLTCLHAKIHSPHVAPPTPPSIIHRQIMAKKKVTTKKKIDEDVSSEKAKAADKQGE